MKNLASSARPPGCWSSGAVSASMEERASVSVLGPILRTQGSSALASQHVDSALCSLYRLELDKTRA